MDKTISTTYRRFLYLKMITKYGIFTLAFLSLLYCILSFFGFDVSWTYVVFFAFAMILRLILSRAFGLCWIHRACILFNFAVSVCIVTADDTLYRIFGIANNQIMGILALIGLTLFGILIWKIKSGKTC